MAKPKKRKFTGDQPFAASHFTATAFATAQDKADGINAIIGFILAGFPQVKFTKGIYHVLSQHLGHSAEYDKHGFWCVWFEDVAKCQEFIQFHLERQALGSAEHTWSDVERWLSNWLRQNHARVAAALNTAREQEEQTRNAEQQRRAAVDGQKHQEFCLAAISTQPNSFGLYGHVLVAQDGSVWEACRARGPGSGRETLEKNTVLRVPLQNSAPQWQLLGFECPERKQDASPLLVAEVWRNPEMATADPW